MATIGSATTTTNTGVDAHTSAPQGVDVKEAAAALAKQIDQLKRMGQKGEATKLLKELSTYKDQQQVVALLSVGLVDPGDTLMQAELQIPPGFLNSAQAQAGEIPTEGTSAWSSQFETLLDRLPEAAAGGDAGARFGLEDVAGHAMPSLFIAGGKGPTVVNVATLLERPGVVEMSADPQVRGEQQNRLEVFKSLDRITQTFWSKMGDGRDASALTDGLGAHVLQPLKVAQAKIADAYSTYMHLGANKSAMKGNGATAAASTEAAGEQVPEIPGPEVQKMEEAAKSAGKLGKAISAQVQKTQVQKIGEGKTDSNMAFGGLGLGSSGKPGDVAFTADIDIDSLMIVVMMQATRVEDDMLSDQLKEMQQTTDQKKQMRAVADQMKMSEAHLTGQMQTEFAEKQADGEIAPSITFDQYKSWRGCQYANINDTSNEDGSHSISWPPAQLESPCPPIPEWLHTGKVDKSTTSDTGKVNLCKTYGLPPQAEAMLRKIFNAMDADTKGAYTDFNDYVATLGFVPATSIEDIKNNLDMLKSAVGAAKDQSKIAKDQAFTKDKDSYDLKVKNFWNDPAHKTDLNSKAFTENPEVVPTKMMPDPADPTKQVPMHFKDQLDAALEQEMAYRMMHGDQQGHTDPDPQVSVPQYDPATGAPLLGADGKQVFKTQGVNEVLSSSKMDPACAAAYMVEAKKVQGQVGAQLRLFKDVAAAVKQGGSLEDVKNLLKTDLTKYMKEHPDLCNGVTAEQLFAPGGAAGAAAGAGIGAAAGSLLGPLGTLFGAGIGALLGGFWNSIFGSDTSTTVNGDTLKFDSSGIHFDVHTHVDNAWPIADQDADKPVDISFPPDTFLGQVQTYMEDPPSGPKGDDVVKLAQGLFGANTPIPLGGSVIDPSVLGLPPDENDPKFDTGMSGEGFDNGNKAIDQWEADMNDPGSQIRRLAAKNHTDGSVDSAATQKLENKIEGQKKIPTDAQGNILNNTGTLDEMDAYQKSMQDKLLNLSDSGDILQMRLQMMMDRRSKFLEALSNMIKKVSDTEDVIVQNMK